MNPSKTSRAQEEVDRWIRRAILRLMCDGGVAPLLPNATCVWQYCQGYLRSRLGCGPPRTLVKRQLDRLVEKGVLTCEDAVYDIA